MEKQKRTIAITSVATLALLIVVCISLFSIFQLSNGNHRLPTQKDTADIASFDEVWNMSNCIVMANYVGQENISSRYIKYRFVPESFVKGTIEDDEVCFTMKVDELNRSNNLSFRNKEKYLLIMNSYSSVYYDNGIRYELYDAIPMEDDKKIALRTGICIDNLIERISSSTRTRTMQEPVIISPFIESDNITEIRESAESIIKIKPTQLLFSSELDGTDTYICEIVEQYKGNISNPEINIVFFKDTISIGNEYIVMINQVAEDSLVYTLASVQNSVWDTNAEIYSE